MISSLAQNTSSLSRSGKASKREIAMAQNVQTALATRVQDASGTFRRKQSAYMQRLKGHEIRHQELSVGGGSLIGGGRKGNSGWEDDNETALREDLELVSFFKQKIISMAIWVL